MNFYIYENNAKDRLDSYRKGAALKRGLKACDKQPQVVDVRSLTALLWRLRPLFS